MSKQKLRFKVKIEGREAGVVASNTPPIDVPEVDGVMPLPRGLKPGSNQTSLMRSQSAAPPQS